MNLTLPMSLYRRRPAAQVGRKEHAMRRRLVPAALLAVYLAFFAWYTSLRGPLSPEEIDHYLGLARGSISSEDGDLERLRGFLESDTGDDFVMVNVIEYREPPTRVPGVEPGDSAADVQAKYMEYMWPALLRRASHPVLMGQAAAPALDVWGVENADHWSMAGLMRYRSRRDLMEVATNPEFGGRHDFKIAAIAKTIAYPIDPWMQLGDPRLVLGLLLLVVGLAWSRRGRA